MKRQKSRNRTCTRTAAERRCDFFVCEIRWNSRGKFEKKKKRKQKRKNKISQRKTWTWKKPEFEKNNFRQKVTKIKFRLIPNKL